MRRRAFIAGIGAAVGLPFAARAAGEGESDWKSIRSFSPPPTR
jgi:hypothetical protein